jgi:hypothetical protein
MHRSRCCGQYGFGRYPSGSCPLLPPVAITPPAGDCGRAAAGATVTQANTAASTSRTASLATDNRDLTVDSIITLRFEERMGPRTR